MTMPCLPLLGATIPADSAPTTAAAGDAARGLADVAPTALVAPGLLFLLCAAAAVGMILMLPGRRETAIRKLGAAVLTAAMLILAVVIGKTAGGMGVYFWVF